jgi:hypothetical protein
MVMAGTRRRLSPHSRLKLTIETQSSLAVLALVDQPQHARGLILEIVGPGISGARDPRVKGM